MALTGNFKTSVALTHSITTDLTTPSESISESGSQAITTGRVYHDQKALTASQTYELDVTDSSLSDSFGNTIAMATVKGLYIKADSANTGTVQVTTGVNSWCSVTPTLAAGESFALLADVDVSTNTKLYIEDSGSAGTFEIVIAGTE